MISTKRTYDTFFEEKLAKKKEGTRKQYHYALKSFENFTKTKHKMNLEQVIKEFRKSKTEKIIDILQNWVNQSNIELRNQKLRVTLVNAYFYYRGIKIDPRDLRDVEFEEGEPEERQALSKEDLMNVVASAKKPIRKALYLSLASSGMAIGESCYIRKKDIDTSQERIKISIQRSYTKRNGRARTVYISKEAGKYLKPILETKQPHDLVFTNSNDPKVTKENEMARFRRLIDSLEIGDRYESGTRTITLHSLRAYFFTKATQKHGLAYAHKMTGHKGYLEEYNRYSEDEKLKMYLELEPELFVFESKPESQDISELKKSVEILKKENKIEVETVRFINKIMRHVASTGELPSKDLRAIWSKSSFKEIGMSGKEITEFTARRLMNN